MENIGESHRAVTAKLLKVRIPEKVKSEIRVLKNMNFVARTLFETELPQATKIMK